MQKNLHRGIEVPAAAPRWDVADALPLHHRHTCCTNVAYILSVSHLFPSCSMRSSGSACIEHTPGWWQGWESGRRTRANPLFPRVLILLSLLFISCFLCYFCSFLAAIPSVLFAYYFLSFFGRKIKGIYMAQRCSHLHWCSAWHRCFGRTLCATFSSCI